MISVESAAVPARRHQPDPAEQKLLGTTGKPQAQRAGAIPAHGVALGWHQVAPLGRKPIVAAAYYIERLLPGCLESLFRPTYWPPEVSSKTNTLAPLSCTVSVSVDCLLYFAGM